VEEKNTRHREMERELESEGRSNYNRLMLPESAKGTFVPTRDVIWFGKYSSGSGFEDGEHWF
jgi:hypothetical protein